MSSSISRRTTPWDGEVGLTVLQNFLKHHYKERYEDRHPLLEAIGETELINSFEPKACPHCGHTDFKRNGRTRNGVSRYKCSDCKHTFTPITGTVFDGHKVSLSEWIEYTLNIMRFININADSWNNRNAFTTSRYWMEKLFLVLEDHQRSVRLSGKVWLDETFYRVRSEDVQRHADGSKLAGLSSNQMCIGVACDKERILCIFEGYGRTSQKKTIETFSSHIEPGSILIHDKESAHKKLVAKLRLRSEAYDSRELKSLPDSKNPLNRINQVHARLKNFLNAHTGFKREKLQGYLDLFSLVMNPPSTLLEKVEVIINLAFENPKSLRYRDFYRIKSGAVAPLCK